MGELTEQVERLMWGRPGGCADERMDGRFQPTLRGWSVTAGCWGRFVGNHLVLELVVQVSE